jgi:hypothetical protein
VFFSASKWGVTRREVWDMVAKGSGVQATTTEFGTLTTEVGNEGLVKIKFAQGADDKVNINLATVKLKDFTAASPSGVSSIVHECLFNPPVLPVLKNSWSATCTTTKTPQSGETTTKEVEVQISTLATESEVVNKKIDDFIAAVPNGPSHCFPQCGSACMGERSGETKTKGRCCCSSVRRSIARCRQWMVSVNVADSCEFHPSCCCRHRVSNQQNEAKIVVDTASNQILTQHFGY